MAGAGEHLAAIDKTVARVSSAKPPSTFFIHGDEEYLAAEARARILSALKARLGDTADFVSLPGSLEDLQLILTELLSGSLFSSAKIVDVPEFTAVSAKGAKKKAQLETFAKRVGSGLPSGKFCVLSTLGAAGGAADFAKSLKGAAVLDFPAIKSFAWTQLTRDPLFTFVKEYLQRAGKSISAEAYLALKDSVGTDLRTICGELSKLCLFVGDRAKIGQSDVEGIVSQTRQQAAFELAGAIAEKDVARAWGALASLLQEKTAPAYIVLSLAGQFRHLLQARIILSQHFKDTDINSMSFFTFRDSVMKELAPLASQFGSGPVNLLTKSPFIVLKTLQLASKFDHRELSEALVKVSEADAELKSSLAPNEELLRGLLFDLTAPRTA